jgi:hypothetical protein
MDSLTRCRAASLALSVCLFSSSCGYTLAGRGGSLPEHIRVIGIPQFTNRSAIPDIDRIVTERVREEFRNRGGRYRVNPDAGGADAVLTGVITSAVPTPTALASGSRQALSYSMLVTLELEFKDVKNNKVLWSNPSMPTREEYDMPAGTTSDPSAFFRQDTNALERLARTVARAIATAVFEAM